MVKEDNMSYSLEISGGNLKKVYEAANAHFASLDLDLDKTEITIVTHRTDGLYLVDYIYDKCANGRCLISIDNTNIPMYSNS